MTGGYFRPIDKGETMANGMLDYVIIDAALKRELDGKPIQYGTVTLQIRAGKVTLVKVEKTIRVD